MTTSRMKQTSAKLQVNPKEDSGVPHAWDKDMNVLLMSLALSTEFIVLSTSVEDVLALTEGRWPALLASAPGTLALPDSTTRPSQPEEVGSRGLWPAASGR